MEGIEKPHTNKYKEIRNYWIYDSSSTVTPLPVWNLENVKLFVFCCTEGTNKVYGRRYVFEILRDILIY
jgi:hypothetical protein